jgi:4-amino-4-deoxy-L-arabinose transferase-like glycosyltransferase
VPWQIISLALICALALLLRLIKLDGPVWGDEIMSWLFANRASLLDTLQVIRSDSTPQLYYILLHYTIPLLGETPFGLRLPSVILGVLAVPLTFLLVREMEFTPEDGLWTAALVACSSILIYYSQEARMYALLIVLSLLSQIALLRCLRRPGLLNAGLYLGLIVLVSYTHRYGLFLFAAQLACLATYRRWKALVVSAATWAGLVAIVAYRYASGAIVPGGSGRAVDVTSWGSLINSLTVGTIGLQRVGIMPNPHLLAFPDPAINRLLPVIGALVLAVIVVGGTLTIKRLGAIQRQGLIVTAICVAVPITLDLLAGSPLSPRPQWLLRAILYIWPFVFALAAILSRRLPGRAYLLAIVIALNCLALYSYFTRYTRSYEGQVLEKLAAEATNDDLIVVDPWYMHPLIRYYYRNHPPLVGYDQQLGWIDVDRLNEIDIYGAIAPPQPFPTVQGRVFVYPRKGGVDWLDTFPDNPVFEYDLKTGSWQPLKSP